MFDTKKFGGYLCRLRKRADMTQSELAERLNLTRQAVSKYELGDSFPDVSVLVLIAEIFKVSLDVLINSGGPTKGEAEILGGVAAGNENITADNVSDIVALAPLLKPSVLGKISEGLTGQGIDISNVVSLASYLSDDSVVKMLENASFDTIDDALLGKLIPVLDEKSKLTIFSKIIEGEMDWHLIRVLLPYAEFLNSQFEAAVVEGALPWEALDALHEAEMEIYIKRKSEE